MRARTVRVFAYILFAAMGMAAAWWYHGQSKEAPPEPAVEIARQPAGFETDLPPEPAAVPQPLAPTGMETPSTPPAIAGRVVLETGDPAAGAEVTAYTANLGAERTRADDGGQFAFHGLRDEAYIVSAIVEGFNRTSVHDVRLGSTTLLLTLQPQSAVTGFVVDAATGEPIPAFEVVSQIPPPADNEHWNRLNLGQQLTWSAVESAEGAFRLGDIPSHAALAIGARAPGYQSTYLVVEGVAPGEAVGPVTLALRTEPRVEGMVLDSQRAPVAGARILLGRESDRGQALATSTTDGSFVIEGLLGDRIELTATQQDFRADTQSVRLIPGQTTAVTFTLGTGASVEGYVTQGGRSLEGAAVGVVMARENKEAVRTDANGYYRIDGVRAGAVSVAARVEAVSDGETLEQMKQAILLDGTSARVDFDFPAIPPTLEGFVTRDGTPAPDVTVTATAEAFMGSTASAQTDADGYYKVTGLPVGVVDVKASDETVTARPSLRTQITLRDGDAARYDFNFLMGAALSGTVTGLAEGETAEITLLPPDTDIELDNPSAWLRLASQGLGSANTEGGDTYALNGVQPGTYLLLAIAFNPDPPQGVNILDTARFVQQTVEIVENIPAIVNVNLSN